MFTIGMVAVVLGYVLLYYGVELLFSTISYQVGNTGVTYGVPFGVLLGLTPVGGKYVNPLAPFTFAGTAYPSTNPTSNTGGGSGGNVVTV